MKKNRKIFLLLFFVSAFLFTSRFAFAIEASYPPVWGLTLNDTSTFPEYARYFFSLLVSIAGTLSALIIIYGGANYLISFGRGKFTENGKDWIKAGLLGLLLTVGSYLVVYTINPDLAIFRLDGLKPVIFNGPIPDSQNPNAPRVTYNEIPLGLLTENTIARTMDCYDFDLNGDPILEQVKTDNGGTALGPSLRDHDRADCIAKLIDAATKKAKVIKDLSDEISKLMQLCKCETAIDNKGQKVCDQSCDIEKPCDDYSGSCPAGKDASGNIINEKDLCSGSCKKAACKFFSKTTANNCCPTDSGVKDPSNPKKNLAVKDLIEHGPIEIGANKTKNLIFFTTYAHLDKISVSMGQNIKKGDALGEVGKVGATGTGAYPHIHFGVGLTDPKGADSISFDIYSVVKTSTSTKKGENKRASGVPGPVSVPSTYTQTDLNTILSLIGAPVSKGYCEWTEVLGSYLHSGYAYWAQDWKCPKDDITDSAQVLAMAGGSDIKSTVVTVNPAVGNVVIKHEISAQSQCNSPTGKYRGLDEFRNLKTNIANIVETKQIKLGGKTIKVIDPAKWSQLKLSEQLTYFQEKIDDIKEKIKKDADNLNSAKNELNRCYFSMPYIDFMKVYEQTDPKNTVILKNKTYSDETTGDKVDISKYCNGFSYGNSTCFNVCQNLCPGDPKTDLACYKNAPKCDPKDFENETAYSNCLAQQQAKITECYNQRKCLDNSNYGNFLGCISFCRGKCVEDCAKGFMSCSPDFAKCRQKCGEDSQCLLENESKCIINAPALRGCVEANNNPYYLKNCIDNSYLCKNGSNQYAGYPECLKPSYSTGKQYSGSFIFEHWDYQKCPSPYAPFETDAKASCVEIYPETEKCPAASNCPSCPCGVVNETIETPSDTNPGTGPCPGGAQMKTCPDGTKSCSCPTANSAPKNVLGSIWGDIAISETCQTTDPGKPGYCSGGRICVKGVCTYGSSDGGGGSGGTSQKISASTVVIGQCSEFSYNDDPLTFYCEQNWWKSPEGNNEKPIGSERFCSKASEIPIGRAVDSTRAWAQSLIKQLEDVSKNIKEMVDYVKKIGNENPQSYCRCDSVCQGGRPCSTNCIYAETKSKDKEGVETAKCSCSFQPCQGVSCQKMINYLDGGKTDNCPAEQDGVSPYYDKINKASKSLYAFLIAEDRSDILKELTYSRTKTSKCSLIKNANGEEAKLLNCKRAEDEIIPPIGTGEVIVDGKVIKAHCYGQNLESLGIKDKTDNWFCCEKR